MNEAGDHIAQAQEAEADANEGHSAASLLRNSITEVPTFYADIVAFVTVGEIVRITFAETMLGPVDSHEAGVNNRYIGHVVMPRRGFEQSMQYMGDRLATANTPLVEGDDDASVD